jgi:pimeloyl-ACP methyl ester carboxylesterase
MKTISFILPFCLACISCAALYKTPVPLHAEYLHERRRAGHDTLFVFLPGHLSTPQDFVREKFIEMLGRYYPRIDSVAVDAGFGYYIKRMLPERLFRDVIEPAHRAGYKKIWLVGISMGGSGALWYAKEHPDTIRGSLLLSPFLGDKPVIEEIETAGGLGKWSPALPLHTGDYQRGQWLWLKQYINAPERLPVLAIGFGDTDRYEKANLLLADILPANRVFRAPGGHDWDTWRRTFREFLSSGLVR